MQATNLLLLGWAIAAALMLGAWLTYRRLGNVGLVDVAWTLAVGSVTTAYAVLGTGAPIRRGVIAGLVGIWGLRLTGFLLRHRVFGQAEDPRYADLRSRRSWAAAHDFAWFFQAQGLLAVLLAMPMLMSVLDPRPGLSPTQWMACALWLAAMLGEWSSDRQLSRFKQSGAARGQTCRAGWWRYSRHPNYFFEWLVWVAYALFALESPGGLVGLVSPTLMLYLLLRVTGIPATEAQALRSRPDYRRYQATTNAFVPWFPRESR